MLEFFSASGDFTRRLTDIRANAKFSSPMAGPEDYFSVSGVFVYDCVLLLVAGVMFPCLALASFICERPGFDSKLLCCVSVACLGWLRDQGTLS